MAAEPTPLTHRRIAWLALVAIGVLLALASLRTTLQPQVAVPLLLDRVGAALGLEIHANGPADYRLRGTPQLEVSGLVVREPGAATPLLRADRLLLAVPWSTLRSGGSALTVTRIELDAPTLDLPSFRHWLATRPPSERKVPTLTDGLQLRDGRIADRDWRVDAIAVHLPSVVPGRPLLARVSGRYLAAPIAVPFDLALALSRTEPPMGLGLAGTTTFDHGNWRMPAHLRLSGPLRTVNGLQLAPARLALAARYAAGRTELPFALGLHAPLRVDSGTLTLAPLALAVRGAGAVPSLDARGGVTLGRTLELRLDGRLPAWPQAWPELPAPLATSTSPLPFALRYAGDKDFGAVAALQLQRDDTRVDARLRLADVARWLDPGTSGSPLPPLDAIARSPMLEFGGATLEGVEITLDDPTVPAVEGRP